MQPLVSICLPTLNCIKFIEEKVISILEQTFKDWNVIVVDGYSNDGTWEFLQKFTYDKRFCFMRVPRRGPYDAWNRAIENAQGEYVYIALVDDTMANNLLEKLLTIFERVQDKIIEGKKCLIAMCDFDYIDSSGNKIENIPKRSSVYGDFLKYQHIRIWYDELIIHLLIGSSWITEASLLIRREIFKDAGLFRTDTILSDMEWAIRSSFYTNIVYTPECLATWRRHSGQSSNVITLRDRKVLLDSVKEVLVKHYSQLPEKWRNNEDCLEILLSSIRNYYLRGFRLDRKTIKENPFGFLNGFIKALVKEPSYAISRLIDGFSWGTLPDIGEDNFNTLRNMFDIQFKPVLLDGGNI